MVEFSYKSFEKKINEVSWEGRIKLAIKGIIQNVIAKRLGEIDKLNLETLKIRFPEAYEAIEDEVARKALVLTGIFQVSPWKGPKENLEIEIDRENSELALAIRNMAIPDNSRLKYLVEKIPKEYKEVYGGKDAVKIFIKSLYILFDEVGERLSPLRRHPWNSKEGYEDEELKSIFYQNVLTGVTYTDNFVYTLYHNNYLERARKRLSKLLEIDL